MTRAQERCPVLGRHPGQHRGHAHSRRNADGAGRYGGWLGGKRAGHGPPWRRRTSQPNLPIDLAVGTRLLRTQQTIDLALDGRPVPVVMEPGFDELRAGDLDDAPMDVYWSWKYQHTSNDRFPRRVSAADGPFHQGVAGVGFEPT
jgi:broad specificity phosphatase PhoE